MSDVPSSTDVTFDVSSVAPSLVVGGLDGLRTGRCPRPISPCMNVPLTAQRAVWV